MTSNTKFSVVVGSPCSLIYIAWIHKTSCTQFGKQWPHPHWLWHMKMFTIWMRLVNLSCPTKQDTKWKEKFVGAKFKMIISLFLMHNKHWLVETRVYLQVSMPKMLWKVVANRLCVVVCKPNGLDDMKNIWELDESDEPSCIFQISKAEVTFNYGQFCNSFPQACW